MKVIGLQEYRAGMMKIMEEPYLTETLQKLESLTFYKMNYSVSGFLANICPCDKKDWYLSVFEHVILPFARMSQRPREKWKEAADMKDNPFYDLPGDGLPFD